MSDALATLMVARDARLAGRSDDYAMLVGSLGPDFEIREQQWRKVNKKTVELDVLRNYFTEVALLRLNERSYPVDNYVLGLTFTQTIAADGKTDAISFGDGHTWTRVLT